MAEILDIDVRFLTMIKFIKIWLIFKILDVAMNHKIATKGSYSLGYFEVHLGRRNLI